MLQLFAECGKLTVSDIDRTVEFTGGIVARHAKIATRLAKEKAAASEEIDELEINPANADFLRGIDLGDTSEEEELSQDGEDDCCDEAEAKWSKAYMAVSSLEHLVQSCDAAQVIAAFDVQLGQNIVTLAWRHENFWIKLVCQRLLGHMFATCQSRHNFASVFGDVFAEKESLVKLVYQMLNVFNSATMNEEMATQLIKNLTFLQG